MHSTFLFSIFLVCCMLGEATLTRMKNSTLTWMNQDFIQNWDDYHATSLGSKRMWNRHRLELGGPQNSIDLQVFLGISRSPNLEKSRQWWELDGTQGAGSQGYWRRSGYHRETQQEAGPAIYKVGRFRCCRSTETESQRERERSCPLAIASFVSLFVLDCLSPRLAYSPLPSPSLRRSAGGGVELNV